MENLNFFFFNWEVQKAPCGDTDPVRTAKCLLSCTRCLKNILSNLQKCLSSQKKKYFSVFFEKDIFCLIFYNFEAVPPLKLPTCKRHRVVLTKLLEKMESKICEEGIDSAVLCISFDIWTCIIVYIEMKMLYVINNYHLRIENQCLR